MSPAAGRSRQVRSKGSGDGRRALRSPGQDLVAVLARKGRFLVGEPFFPQDAPAPTSRRGGDRRQVVVGPTRGRGPVRARPGDLVLLSQVAPGRSQVNRVIGRPDAVGDVIEALMLDRGLRRGFDHALEREASAADELAGEGGGRLDLRALATFTVDPATAQDFDDAISAESREDGAVRVWVHIADVSAYVREGSGLDREARRRGTSVYVPGAVEPMLPEALSNGFCSLRPGEDRFAVSVEMDVRDGLVVRSAFHRSLIRSDARLHYDQVDGIFAGEGGAEGEWGRALAQARLAAAALGERRATRGTLEIDSFEPEFSFDGEGGVSVHMAGWSAAGEAATAGGGAGALRSSEARRMIEHLMIAANETVAEHLAARGLPCLYRVHERPEPQRVEFLVRQLESLDVPTPPVPERMSSSQAAELLIEVAAALHRHLDALAERRHGERGGSRMALNTLVLRTLQQAYYSPRNLGHAGLGSSAYCHFTSPIRRYPDIVCHRALLASLGATSEAPRAAELGELGAWTSEREREAMVIERAADDVARCFALEQRLFAEGWGRAFSGEVTGLISAGLFVSFGEGSGEPPPFEGMLPVRRLRIPAERRPEGLGRPSAPAGGRRGRARPGRGSPSPSPSEPSERDWWELDELGTSLHAVPSGRTLRLGDPLTVKVVRVENARGRVELEPVGRAR